MAQPESKLVQRIRTHLERRQAWVFKVHGGDNPFQEVGIPDLLCCWQGMFIGLEVKLPGEKASLKQLHVIAGIREAGGIAEVVSSVADVDRVLKRTTRK
jgi:hypothetical protein